VVPWHVVLPTNDIVAAVARMVIVARVQFKFDSHEGFLTVVIDAPCKTIWKLRVNLIDLEAVWQMWQQEAE
jgi:hypothetical protein